MYMKYTPYKYVFPRGSQKRKSNNDDKHDHGEEIKGDPQHYVEGTNNNMAHPWGSQRREPPKAKIKENPKCSLNATEVLLFWILLIFRMSLFKYISNDSRIAAGRLGP